MYRTPSLAAARSLTRAVLSRAASFSSYNGHVSSQTLRRSSRRSVRTRRTLGPRDGKERSISTAVNVIAPPLAEDTDEDISASKEKQINQNAFLVGGAVAFEEPYFPSASHSADETSDDIPAQQSVPLTKATFQPACRSFRDVWTALPPLRKPDLSHWHPVKGKRRGTPRPIISYAGQEHPFRGDLGSTSQRRITKLFMQHVYPHTTTSQLGSDETIVCALRRVYPHDMRRFYDQAEDVLTWSWILLAPSATRSILRLTHWSDHLERAGLPPVPLWVSLQMLRLQHIDAESLSRLIALISRNRRAYRWWGDSAILLIVRMLRHARIASPSSFEKITTLFLDVLDAHLNQQRRTLHSRLPIITYWCNRVLSLMSLPVSLHPFRSMSFQQAAQLTLMRYMQNHVPTIPLNREGYRAIAALQTMHRKTATEKDWARLKSINWPPWEQKVLMGAIIRPRIYSGRFSRVIKVLQRTQESGYPLRNAEIAMQVLAGWDTDRSPTIQMRRKISLHNSSALFRPTSVDDPVVWAARVEATRTVREAWMCFCSYSTTVPVGRQVAQVYHVMFTKLFAKVSPNRSERGTMPGDGLETYPDPESARERVWVPEEIPSIEDFFSRMVKNNVRPSLRLLSDLLDHPETSLDKGLQYVSCAYITSGHQCILTKPEEQNFQNLIRVLKVMPNHFSRAYIGLLARPNTPKGAPWRFFGEAMGRRLVGPVFVGSLLEKSGIREPSIWNAYFAALFQHAHDKFDSFRKLQLTTIWMRACQALCSVWHTVPLNYMTFESVAHLAFVTETMSKATQLADAPTDPGRLMISKKMFMVAASGSSRREFCSFTASTNILHSVPRGDAIEAMVWVLATAQNSSSVDDMVQLLRWTRHHLEQIKLHGHGLSKHNLAAFKTFLTGVWALKDEDLFDEVYVATEEQMQEVEQLAGDMGGWPDDEYIATYMMFQRGKIERIRRLLRSRVRLRIGKEEVAVPEER
ncbi:hypothetical protein LTR64_001334 [Lithohypha guttulata]|uniref:uncharacterized protein n=1 Tax=Lithohypha guttulata TaxID=1690604 RepID=UPI002DDF8717|nr:hypothetical protein LTR51_003528 [Lithohypha guttulata]